MGLESYLFYVHFKSPPTEEKAIEILQQAGMTYLPDMKTGHSLAEFRDHYLELRSRKGLTEINILLSPGKEIVDDFSLRFSVLSPATVVYQTFDFLKKLNDITPVLLKDSEITQHLLWELREGPFGYEQRLTPEIVKQLEEQSLIPLDAEEFCRNEMNIGKRKTVLGNKKGWVIEGGAATTAHIARHGLAQKIWGWLLHKL